MCRWLVYQGPRIYLEDILFKPRHSLIQQALHAREIEWPTNGDGFGIGWYADRASPGVFRDVMPIWNDMNLRSLAGQVSSGLFFAHIRKATGGAIQRTNCHPFAHGRLLFQHNGLIPAFAELRQKLYAKIDERFFPMLQGSTDSECMFMLALTCGLEQDLARGIDEMIRVVEDVRSEVGIDLDQSFRCTCAVSDGEKTVLVRYATHGDPFTLYYSTDPEALRDFEERNTLLPEGAVIVASEPLGEVGDAWTPVPPSGFITVKDGRVTHDELVEAPTPGA